MREQLTRFFTAPTNGSSASLFRIAFGVVATWTALGVWLNLHRYYGADGLVPWHSVQHFPELLFSPFILAPGDDRVVQAIAVVFLGASVTLTLGVLPRLSALFIFITNVWLQHRNPYVLNGGDRLFLILAGLAALLPLGARWSLSRAEAQPRWVWGQRIIQLQIAYIYLSSCFGKLGHDHWLDGTALVYILASPTLSEWPMQLEPTLPLRLMTWGALAFELGFPILVWHQKLRPWLLAAGVAFHLSIEALLKIPIFSAMMITSYACFLSDAQTERLLSRFWRLRRSTADMVGTAEGISAPPEA